MERLRKFENQEIWCCEFMSRRLNFNPYSISLCHEAQVGDRIICKVEELTPETFYAALTQIIENANLDANYPCRACSKCVKKPYKFQKFNYVTICTSEYCNSSCIYCTGHFGQEGAGYNPIPYLEMFYLKGSFAPGCYFDWGGGEPTLNPFYEDTVNWIYQHGHYQRFNTSAILFSEMTAIALKNGKGNVRISVDSGTEETFKVVKGTDKHDDVWGNIQKYCSVSDDVYIKYNVCNYNSDMNDIDCFIEKCCKNGVKNIIIDGEVDSYHPAKNAGPTYYREKELDAAKYLERAATGKGLNVRISGYAYSVRGEYDEKGNVKLPEKYYNNIDMDVITNDVYLATFATVEQLLDRLASSNDIPVVIGGTGALGKIICNILQKKGIKVQCIVDFIGDSKDTIICDVPVTTFRKVRKEFEKVHMILAGNSWKLMLRQINNDRYMINGYVYYMRDVYFHKYQQQLG